ncbi:MAG: dihydrodipicolinate synthase family protein [Planctomycetia bacterium]|nr:dihydrodipicolinate synthase family protein [Planctomycetia bacterium]
MIRYCLTLLLIFACSLQAQDHLLCPPVNKAPLACCRPAWSGIYPTVLTPWNCTGCGVDTEALARQIKYQLFGRVNGLLVLGTLGEGMYASHEERAQVISTAVAVVQGKVPVVVGIHSSDIFSALDQLKQAKNLGASAVLVKYTGPARTPFCDILGFYQMLAQAHELPVFYYHMPGSVDRPLKADEVIQILSLDNVIGAKESTLDLREVQKHISGTTGLGKVFLSGTALNLTQFQAIGGHGAMCPEAAILPVDTVLAFETAYETGARRDARAQQRDLFILAPLLKGGIITANSARMVTMTAQDLKLPQRLGRDTSQARLKATLHRLGFPMNSIVKPDLPQLSAWDRHIVNSTVNKLSQQ